MPSAFRFVPPSLSVSELKRPRLLRVMSQRFEFRLTVVTGGAGHGKTTLLAQALAENALDKRGEDVWLNAEAGDNDEAWLAADMLTALGAPRADATVAAIADAVWRRAPEEVCIVIDDVHRLTPDAAGAQVLTSLLDALPGNGHVLLSGRSIAAVPHARLASQHAVVSIDEQALRYDAAELRDFGRARDLTPKQLAHTGGWPAIAELVASSGSATVGDFLWEEVLRSLGTSEQRLLAVLCEIGGGDDRLLSKALGEPVMLESRLPLVSVDAHGWRVPHALWRDVAALALPQRDRVEIRRRAADELLRRGLHDAAFNLLADGGLEHELGPVLSAACADGQRPTASLLRSWLARCPEDVAASPSGQLARGVLSELTAPELAVAPLRNAMQAFRDGGDIVGELSAISHLGTVAWWRRDLVILGELLPRAMELEASGSPVAGGLAAIGRALICLIVGDTQGVLDALDASDPSRLDVRWQGAAGWLRALALYDLGDEDGSRVVLEHVGQLGDPSWTVTANSSLATARWMAGDLDGAATEVAAVIAAAEAAGAAQEIAYIASAGARACVGTGDLDGAKSCLAAATRVSGNLTPAARVQIALAQAAIAVAEGNEDAAAQVLGDALVCDPNQGDVGRVWASDLVMTYVLIEEQRAYWDGVALSARQAWVRELARALSAVRHGDIRRLGALNVDDVARIRAAMPCAFATELAIALHRAKRVDDATRLFSMLPDAARSHARRLNTPNAKALLAAVPGTPVDALSITTFGRLLVNGRTVERGRVKELLAYLILTRTTTRDVVTSLIWPDLDDRAASNNLRVTLSHLVRLLEPERGEGEATYRVRHADSEIQLVADARLDIDLDRFDLHLKAAAQAERDGAPSIALEQCLGATELYRGELFAELRDVTWVDLERERARRGFVGAGVRAAELLTAAAEFDRAESLAQRVLAVDEWSEAAYNVLANIALRRGDRAGALRFSSRCTAMLAELGVDASTATSELVRRIREPSGSG